MLCKLVQYEYYCNIRYVHTSSSRVGVVRSPESGEGLVVVPQTLFWITQRRLHLYCLLTYTCTSIFQLQNIKTLCNAPLSVAQSHCPQLVADCEVLRDKFEPLFALFARCHTIYDATCTPVDQLQELRTFM